MSATDYPCVVDDLANYLPPGLSIDDASWPSKTAVSAMIANVADEINGLLRSRGYALPWSTSDTDGLKLLNTINVYGALARFGRSKFPSDSGPGGSKGFAEEYEKKYQAQLDLVRADALGLPDQGRQDVIAGFENSGRPWVRRGSVF